MRGLMMDWPLTLQHFVDRAERLFADKHVATTGPAGVERIGYGEWAERTRRLSGALDELGVSPLGRVATFAWNTSNHLELYFAAPCAGRVVHTLNIRLFAEQLEYIINHAEDEVIFADASLLELLLPVLPRTPTVRHLIVMGDGPVPPVDAVAIPVHRYDDLLTADPVAFRRSDEKDPAGICYTSGTTGNPKGVVSTHRSIVLHTFGVLAAGGMAVSETDTILPVVPMFHAYAWGLAHAAVASGANLVLPGSDLSGPAVARLIADERVTLAAGVPTIWMSVLPELRGREVPSLRAVLCGGSAVPKALSESFRAAIGLPIQQAWGMTETSPVGTVGRIKSTLAATLTDDELVELRTSVGQPSLGVETRIVDDSSQLVEWDGVSRGELQVRGPWVASGYYADDRSAESFTDDGWLRTGDVATIDPHGYVRLVDRTKDVIKSGGEWISSVELENEIMSHPDVIEAAVIGVPDPRWQERPLAYVVRAAGSTVSAEDLRTHLEGRVAKWWLPEEIRFIDEIPKTSVGKFSKKDLRDLHAKSCD